MHLTWVRSTLDKVGWPIISLERGNNFEKKGWVNIGHKCTQTPSNLQVKVHLKKVSKKLQKPYQSDPKNACSSIVTSVFFFVAFLYSSTAASFTFCLMRYNNSYRYFLYLHLFFLSYLFCYSWTWLQWACITQNCF